MTAFDWTIIGVIALSMLFAFMRGVTRELIALVSWVVGFLAALAFSPVLGDMLPAFGGSPVVPYLVAFAIILIAALLLGALIAYPLGNFIRKAGLGFVDRFLGAAFGIARGLVLVIAFVLVAGLTGLPRENWWHNAALAQPLATVALALSPWLPPEWARRLDYSREGRTLRRAPAELKV